MDNNSSSAEEKTEKCSGIELKNKIRKEMLKKRSELSIEDRTKAALAVTDRILGHQWYYNADTILIFIGYGSEIDTSEIIDEALKSGKRVFAPKVKGNDMDFYEINKYEELELGYKGIPEPDGRSARFDYYSRTDSELDRTLIIMPGVAFDMENNRIGYGKGFYDRYLQDKEALRLHSISIGFKCQISEERIPAQEHDLKPYQVICM
jgi:5-formyltetrahydrofolate cyclo-ligase